MKDDEKEIVMRMVTLSLRTYLSVFETHEQIKRGNKPRRRRKKKTRKRKRRQET